MAERAKATREAAAKNGAAARRAGGIEAVTKEAAGAGTAMAEATGPRNAPMMDADAGKPAVTKAAARMTAPANKTATAAAKAPTKKAAPAEKAPPVTRTASATKVAAKVASTRPDTPVAVHSPKPARKYTRSPAESDKIRAALGDRRKELHIEYDQTMAEITELQRDRLTDSAGDDQADTGTKTFEREQEISLANSILEKINQVERALERLDGGSYGWCERCADAIPVERLAAFPSATLCVSCKQLEERR